VVALPLEVHCCVDAHVAPTPHRHAPASQRFARETAQLAHVTPPRPHVVSDGTRHAPLSQQPFGHDVASHTHVEFTQRCPLEHEGPAPHPEVHTPATQLWPAAQTLELPHRHAPATHESARLESHAAHAEPA